MKNIKPFVFLLIVDICVAVFIFSFSGIYNDKLDTAIYVSQIQGFSDPSVVIADPAAASFRFFKPFYGIAGSIIGPWTIGLSPYNAILVINLLFFVGLTFLSYLFFKKIGLDEKFSIAGAAWVAMGYPMLKYGLALGTDISGWFFAVAVIVLFLHAIQTGKIRYVFLASLVGFVGSLTKETGVLGLIFAGVYILMQIGNWDWSRFWKWMAALCIPFFALEAGFQYFLYKSGAPSFVEWYKWNHASYAREFYKFKYFIGVEGSTFSIILLLALIGMIIAIKNRDILKRSWLSLHLSLLIATLPMLVWPIFLSRVLFVQFIIFFPLALYTIWHLRHQFEGKQLMTIPILYYILFLYPILSIILFIISGNGPLLKL